MQYKYFTKQLLAKSNEIDLANIFPEKQKLAKEKLNTNYSLAEIADWIKENTNSFKRSENYFIDIDQAIKRLVFKYYESTNISNPFLNTVDDISYQSPRIPSEVTIDGVKSGKVDIVEKIVQVSDEIQSIKDAIEYLQIEADGGDEQAKEALDYLTDELKSLTN